jgi:hypothetical protein
MVNRDPANRQPSEVHEMHSTEVWDRALGAGFDGQHA